MIIFLHQILCTILLHRPIFFRNVHHLIKVKAHIHHSHITGKIVGCSHDFCNWTVGKNISAIEMITHNLFGLDMFFFIKGCRATAWGTKDLNIGGPNLTHFNCRNIGSKVNLLTR